MAASESTAIDAVGGETLGDVGAGEALFLREGEEPIRRVLARPAGVDASAAPCIFEQIYFARPRTRGFKTARSTARAWPLDEPSRMSGGVVDCLPTWWFRFRTPHGRPPWP